MPRPLSHWLLTASLSLNVFLVTSIAVGLAWHGFRRPPPPPPDPLEIADDMASGLPAADAAILRQAFADRSAVFARARGLHADTPARIRQVLEQPEYDPRALQAIFVEARAAHEAMDTALEATVTEAVGRMSPEGRHKLAEWEPPGRHRP
jgi:uncharacterized membrane protein